MSEKSRTYAAGDIAYTKAHLVEWLAEQSLGNPPAVCEIELIKSILEQMDKRFDELTRRIDRFMVWSFATTLTVSGLVVAALKLWP